MNSILADLFKGEIDIMETLPFRKKGPDPDEMRFFNTLTPEQQEIYEQIQNMILDRCALENQDCFVAGFKMGVRIILESLTNTEDEEALI